MNSGYDLLSFSKMTLLTALMVILLAACNSTKMVSTYTDPDVSPDREKFKKIMVAVVTTNEQARRAAEDKLAAKGDRLFASHKLLSNEQITKSLPQSKGLIEEEGFDAVVTMKLLQTKTSSTPVAGYFNGDYWGYHTNFWTGFYQPGYWREDTNYYVETNVFSLEEGKVLWSGITTTTNISQANRVIGQVADEVHRQMLKDGFITK